jgi:AbrB family looped-hinge helix DNA binding protein
MGSLQTISHWEKPVYNGIMTSKVTLDQAGRVVLPKALRDELRLAPGDTLDLSVQGEEVTLRPRRAETGLEKERGVWVFRSGNPLTAVETEQALRNLRLERQRQVEGESR